MTRNLYFLPMFIFILLALLFFYLLLIPRDKSQLNSALLDKPAPNFQLENFNGGEPISNKNLQKGKLYLINIFASWCLPCRLEHENLMELATNNKIEIIGINYKDKKQNAQSFLDELGNPYSQIAIDETGRAAIDWGVYGVPESFLINKQGIIVHKVIGPIVDNEYEKLLLLILKHEGHL